MTNPPAHKIPPAGRGEILSWAFFDFANSAYVTVIVSVVGSLYFKNSLMGGSEQAVLWWGWAAGLANAFVVILSPLVGALADARARKKLFLLITYLLCFLGTLLFGLPVGWMIALAGFFFAQIGFSLGENLISSFLPEIAPPGQEGRISALGWGIGYFGGLLSLGLVLLMIQGLKLPASSGVLATAAFFLLAGLPTMIFLRERATPTQVRGATAIASAVHSLLSTLKNLRNYPLVAIFFAAFFCLMAGLGNIVYFTPLYAEERLGTTQQEIIVLFVALQLAAAAGAWFFGWLQDAANSRSALMTAVALWIGVVIGAFFMQSKTHLYIVGIFAGIAMGGSQCTARAVVGMLAPEGKSGEYYGLWGVFGKLSAVVGLPLFSSIAARFNMQAALFSTFAWFLIALILLIFMTVPKRGSNNAGEKKVSK